MEPAANGGSSGEGPFRTRSGAGGQRFLVSYPRL
jgi:hypothetical protein